MATHLLGIRHHGPGSCRNVASYLEELKPDLILLEGPPEADGLLKDVVDPQMVPLIALLAYQPDAPQNAVFYPFADFSPNGRQYATPCVMAWRYACLTCRCPTPWH